jgi:hypothetical protein
MTVRKNETAEQRALAVGGCASDCARLTCERVAPEARFIRGLRA